MELFIIPEGQSVDVATDRTVKLMAAFARDAVNDPEVRRCANAAGRLARGRGALAFALGVWMWLKHSIRFRRDEITMTRLGVGQHFDLVMDPRLLVRMRDPAEDCDGFVTTGAALLRCLGVPFFFAAAATEYEDPHRWSHTWLVVPWAGRLVDLDASHGRYFGWGVPLHRRFRFGLWDSDGWRIA